MPQKRINGKIKFNGQIRMNGLKWLGSWYQKSIGNKYEQNTKSSFGAHKRVTKKGPGGWLCIVIAKNKLGKTYLKKRALHHSNLR